MALPDWKLRSKTLIVCPQYPSTDDLYRYAFLHTRIRHYLAAEEEVDVFRVSPRISAKVRQFDGVYLAEGSFRILRLVLSARHHSHIATHTLTPGFWKAFQKHRYCMRLTAWVHGAEAQPWFRRNWLHQDAQSRVRARAITQRRLQVWRRFLEGAVPDSDAVFVSKHQALQVINDTGATVCRPRLHVIPNPIDTDLFTYREKSATQRFRVLSLRPYTNATYANDLTVKAILALSQHPEFSRFHFTIVGDGPLFDSTVSPLRQFSNVTIHKGFLAQRDLPALYKEHGVFLCPSRMDTHGVSRDEAMASGLVPITTRIAAIPEFVDHESGLLVEPEDHAALAEALLRLANEPELYMKLSAASSRRVRKGTSCDVILPKEVSILRGSVEALPTVSAEIAHRFRIAVYADINPNAIDGSSIWLASVAEVLGRIPNVSVTLFLKAPLQRTLLIEGLLRLSETVRVVEPDTPEGSKLNIPEAIGMLDRHHAKCPYDAVLLRGRSLCLQAASTSWAKKVWAYLTDVPQMRERWKTTDIDEFRTIVHSCQWLLCQTQALADHFAEIHPHAQSKLRLLPPAIPSRPLSTQPIIESNAFRMCYAGKFARAWGIEEMLRAHKNVRRFAPLAECHVFGDKFHNAKGAPHFVPSTKQALTNQPGVVWHGAVSRDRVMNALTGMHAAWAFRHASVESETLELSTKLIEYASLGVPPICVRNQVNQTLLGSCYPYFAESGEEAAEILLQMATSQSSDLAATECLARAAEHHSFEAVARLLRSQGMIPSSI
jgi:glycosyltransferase involved in cell wall biosynthesis